MPFLFVPALMGALAGAMASLAGRALLALGVGFVTYKGIDLAIGAIKTSVMAGVNSLPADALGLVGFLWIDKGLTVIFSAVAASLALKGINGSIKKMNFK
jgi:Protein of unknown function (DUF2523)